jgi:hypothetical protein
METSRFMDQPLNLLVAAEAIAVSCDEAMVPLMDRLGRGRGTLVVSDGDDQNPTSLFFLPLPLSCMDFSKSPFR